MHTATLPGLFYPSRLSMLKMGPSLLDFLQTSSVYPFSLLDLPHLAPSAGQAVISSQSIDPSVLLFREAE